MTQMKLFTVCLVPIASLMLGCQSILDWNSGTNTIQCTHTNVVGTTMQNQTGLALNINFCSLTLALPSYPQKLTSDPQQQSFSEIISSSSEKTGGMAGDNCQDRGVFPNRVGNIVPLLSAVDQANFKLCYYPPDPSSVADLYVLVAIATPCPGGSAVFDPSTVTCK